jgi:hypothetical protein
VRTQGRPPLSPPLPPRARAAAERRALRSGACRAGAGLLAACLGHAQGVALAQAPSSEPEGAPGVAAPSDPSPTDLPAVIGPGDPLPIWPEDRWTVRLHPRLWYVAHGGRLTMPSLTGAPIVDGTELSDLGADKSRVAPYATFDIQGGPVIFSLAASNVSVRGSSVEPASLPPPALFEPEGVPPPAGQITARLETTLAQILAGYRVYTVVFDQGADPSQPDAASNVLRLFAVGGARYYELNSRVLRNTTTGDRSEDFIDAVLGARAQLQLARVFSVELDLNAGLGTGSSLEVAVSFGYHPWSWLGVHVGYRNVFLDASAGRGATKYRFDGSLAGLFAGVSVRF